MINGEGNLRRQYPNLEEEQYQPAGIDLTVGEVSVLNYNKGTVYGLLKNAKVLPRQEEIKTATIQIGGMLKDVYMLQPNSHYIVTTQEKIKIDNRSGQFYLPRSSLLRAGVDVRTAFGDPGFDGHLSFLVINHGKEPFALEKGVRFAQLVDINVVAPLNEYDGDYNEE